MGMEVATATVENGREIYLERESDTVNCSIQISLVVVCCFWAYITTCFVNIIKPRGFFRAIPNGPPGVGGFPAVLPVDPYQLSVLSMKSLKERLTKIQHILTYFSRDQSK